ncbi:hypothetical protein L6452_21790 [Arctium lappa]|uniref:Uncharacterized protein n=1 Tax=Arctium lappa TaxID=4217 RepID=A0ACB9AY11_ARCLA|nr:hypothetical protein L6452_21790 [Arctium lappa]
MDGSGKGFKLLEGIDCEEPTESVMYRLLGFEGGIIPGVISMLEKRITDMDLDLDPSFISQTDVGQTTFATPNSIREIRLERSISSSATVGNLAQVYNIISRECNNSSMYLEMAIFSLVKGKPNFMRCHEARRNMVDCILLRGTNFTMFGSLVFFLLVANLAIQPLFPHLLFGLAVWPLANLQLEAGLIMLKVSMEYYKSKADIKKSNILSFF